MKILSQIVAQLRKYEEPGQESLQLGGDVWLHVTPSYNVESIMESGLGTAAVMENIPPDRISLIG